jgi:hypothetical protein
VEAAHGSKLRWMVEHEGDGSRAEFLCKQCESGDARWWERYAIEHIDSASVALIFFQ